MRFHSVTKLSLIFLAFLSLTTFADQNEQVREWFVDVNDDNATAKSDALSYQAQFDLFKYVVEHKVAKTDDPKLIEKYDPTGEIGYCYGRAMAVHLRARRMGLKKASIKKLFIIGDLRQAGATQTEWRFHVTTVVKGPDGKWWAVDPILLKPQFAGKPILAENWIRTVRQVWDQKREAKIYFVDNLSVLPDIREFRPLKTDETHESIMDLTFKPKKHPGFKKITLQGETVFELDEKAQEKHFLRAKESVDADQFDFSRLKMSIIAMDLMKGELAITKKDYDYNNYFEDLVDDIRKSTYKARAIAAPGTGTGPGVRPTVGPRPMGTEIHFAPDGTEIHGTEIHGTEIHRNQLFSPRFGLRK